jgi:hypothetical protein
MNDRIRRKGREGGGEYQIKEEGMGRRKGRSS